MLLKAQRAPVLINKNGKPAAVVMSADEFETFEMIKLQLLQARAAQAQSDIVSNNLTDGEQFFDKLESGHFDG